MQYKVPQNVQREDQILWFITLRQLIIMMIGFGISYIIFVNVGKNEEPSFPVRILIWLPAAISVAFAFLRIRSIPLPQFILLFIEQTFFRFPRRYWMAGVGEPFVSITTRVTSLQKKLDDIEAKEFDPKKAKDLAEFLDNQKSDFDPNKKEKYEK